ncbi:hypothetical protein J6590_102007 [Homalodisca vitripennis]|nr:hypothetical protein J6590_102007 [Homalodisca vitripennis]
MSVLTSACPGTENNHGAPGPTPPPPHIEIDVEADDVRDDLKPLLFECRKLSLATPRGKNNRPFGNTALATPTVTVIASTPYRLNCKFLNPTTQGRPKGGGERGGRCGKRPLRFGDDRRLTLDELSAMFPQIPVTRNNHRNSRISEIVCEMGSKTADRTAQVELSAELQRVFLERYELEGDDFLYSIVTGDETLVTHYTMKLRGKRVQINQTLSLTAINLNCQFKGLHLHCGSIQSKTTIPVVLPLHRKAPTAVNAHPNYYMCTGVFASHSTKIDLLRTLYIANPSAYLRALNSTADPC